MGSIMERADLILKINFKRDIVVISALTMALINFCINLLIIAVIGIILIFISHFYQPLHTVDRLSYVFRYVWDFILTSI